MTRSWVLASLFVCVVVVTGGCALFGTGEVVDESGVRGTVVNFYGNPVAGAIVQGFGAEGTTDVNGRFTFGGVEVEDGEHELTVLVEGETVFADDVFVEDDEVTATIYVKDDENLLENPGFEFLGADQLPVQWNPSQAVEPGKQFYVVEDPVSGKYAAALKHESSGSVHLRSENIPASPGERFHAKAFIKNSEGKTSGVFLKFYDASGKEVGSQGRNATSTTWAEAATASTAPEETAFVRIMFWQGSGSQGSISYFDDVTLTKTN